MPRFIHNQIINHCLIQLPNEACGALQGTYKTTSMSINQFLPLTNAALRREGGFEVDRNEWVQLLYEKHLPNQQLLGMLHSHPTTDALPSPLDLRSLWHTLPTHWIVSCINKNNPTMRAFSFRSDGSYELIYWVIQD